MGYSATFYSALTTAIILASAVGTIGSGRLADRYGRRAIIVGSLILSAPAIWLFAEFTGPVAFVTGPLVGFLAASTGPLMLVMAQQLMVGRAGVAAGLVLGLGFVTGALGVPVMGAVADEFGMRVAMRTQIVVVLATIAIAWLLPTEARIRGVPGPTLPAAEPVAARAP